MNISKLIKLAKGFESKGWELIGELEGLPLLRHLKSKTEAVIDDATGKLMLKSSFAKTREIRNGMKAAQDKAKAAAKEAAAKTKKIAKSILSDAEKRLLGMLDFGTKNWFNYLKGYNAPKENIEYYEKQFLPQILETYTKLIDDGMMYYDPKLKQVIGMIEGKPTVLNTTEDKMAYIVTNTPNASHLYFDGTAYGTGVPLQYVRSFLAHGGPSASGKPNWGSSNLASQAYYAGRGGLSGIFTSIKPKLIKKFIKVGTKSRVPEQAIPLTPTAVNPTTHRFIGNNTLNAALSHEPLGYQTTTRAIRDDAASSGLNTDVFAKMQITGTELPLKAILGNSGRYNMNDPNPANMIIAPLLLAGGAGGLALTANERSN